MKRIALILWKPFACAQSDGPTSLVGTQDNPEPPRYGRSTHSSRRNRQSAKRTSECSSNSMTYDADSLFDLFYAHAKQSTVTLYIRPRQRDYCERALKMQRMGDCAFGGRVKAGYY